VRALIVDDSPVMLKSVERQLRLAGIDLTEILHARDGKEGMEVLRFLEEGETIDFILAANNTPLLGGLEFLERRLAAGLAQGVPAAIVASEDDEPLHRRAIAAGAYAYLRKPLDADEIRARLLPLLATRH
jgi:two-component system chemotaxis response regulator CheY